MLKTANLVVKENNAVTGTLNRTKRAQKMNLLAKSTARLSLLRNAFISFSTTEQT